jgi:hypothetical protein
MFDEIFGLPAHPLIIHAAVVLTPLLAALSVAYAVLPRFRPQLGWAVVLMALAAPATVFAARQSGGALAAKRYGSQLPEGVAEHAGFSFPLLLATAGLAVVALVLVFVTRPRREPEASGGSGGVVPVILSVVSVLLAVAVGYYVVRAGHTGATSVWGA